MGDEKLYLLSGVADKGPFDSGFKPSYLVRASEGHIFPFIFYLGEDSSAMVSESFIVVQVDF